MIFEKSQQIATLPMIFWLFIIKRLMTLYLVFRYIALILKKSNAQWERGDLKWLQREVSEPYVFPIKHIICTLHQIRDKPVFFYDSWVIIVVQGSRANTYFIHIYNIFILHGLGFWNHSLDSRTLDKFLSLEKLYPIWWGR